MYCILYIINTILLITIIILIYKNNKNNKEQFVTWFKPYYTNNLPDNPLLNTKEIYDENTLAHQYNFKKLILGTYQESNTVDKSLYNFLIYLTKIIVQHSNILDIHVKNIRYAYKLMDDLNKNKVSIAYAPSPILYESLIGGDIFGHKILHNIRFISNINNVSIFFFVSNVGKVKSLYDLKGTNIGVVGDKSTSFKCASDLLEQLELDEDDYTFKYHSLMSGLDKLNNGIIDCFIYDAVFPSIDLKNYFEKNIGTSIRLLPLDEINEKTFISRFVYYEPIYLDLNKLSENYLPATVGEFKFNKYKSMLKTYSFHNYLLCHKSLDNNTSYNLIKSIYNNIDEINKLELFRERPLFRNNIGWSSLPISIHAGVKKFLYEKGYISYGGVDKNGKIIDNPNCLFLVSKKECNKKNLEILDVPPLDYTFMNEHHR
jgi:TRAP-type uncharacterized transport system substrate-binding protein